MTTAQPLLHSLSEMLPHGWPSHEDRLLLLYGIRRTGRTGSTTRRLRTRT